jgi:hypothetical protein
MMLSNVGRPIAPFESLLTLSGVAGVAHIASIVGSPDPNVMIPGVVNGAISILRSAMAEPSVKAVVYTSSSWAAASPAPNLKSHIDSDLWNEAAIKSAWDPPPYGVDRVMPVYAASKALAERECWKFMKEQKPNFSFNAGIERSGLSHKTLLNHPSVASRKFRQSCQCRTSGVPEYNWMGHRFVPRPDKHSAIRTTP